VEIILATQNAGKLKEFNELAKDSGLTFIPIPVEHTFPEETGHTFFENAFIKANYVFSLTGLPSIGDDSGLEVDVLNGRPGIHSSRYSREGTDKSNVDKLLLELRSVQDKDRSARFKCCLVLIQNSQSDPISAEGVVEGKISEGERGNKGFGYDPVFIPKGSLLHMAEIEENEKNLISHRANAFRSLIKKLPRGFAKE